MKIANPIYDAVFKYLLEDKRVAKLLLSTILDEEILEIQVQPTEHSIELEKLLLFFDQSNAIEDKHTLSIHEDQIPEQHHLLLDRLRRAIEDQKIRGAMDVEDDIVLELEDKDREIQRQRERAEQERERAELEKIRAQQAQQREEQEKNRADKESARAEENQQKLAEALKRLQELEKKLSKKS